MRILVCLMLACTAFTGCIQPGTTAEEEAPGRSFVAPLLGADGTSHHDLNLSDNLTQGPVLLFFMSESCTGCHAWTEVLATAHPMWMTLDPPLQIIGVHRYGSFESPEMLHERYGNMSSSTFAPWPILLPEPTTTVFDPSTGATRAASFFEAFDTPVTPSFILLDQEGRDVWTGREYQPGTGSLDSIGAAWASVVGDSEGGMA